MWLWLVQWDLLFHSFVIKRLQNLSNCGWNGSWNGTRIVCVRLLRKPIVGLNILYMSSHSSLVLGEFRTIDIAAPQSFTRWVQLQSGCRKSFWYEHKGVSICWKHHLQRFQSTERTIPAKGVKMEKKDCGSGRAHARALTVVQLTEMVSWLLFL